LFGVPSSFLGLLPGRVTYIIDTEGIVRGIFNSQLNATQHIDEALKVVRGL
jgi:peroxiredoxin Q/BCP